MRLRHDEDAKIESAKEHFKAVSDGEIVPMTKQRPCLGFSGQR